MNGEVGRGGSRWLAAVCLLCSLWLGLHGAPAQARDSLLEQMQLQRTAEALYLSVRLKLEPSPAVEDALFKGVPLYFAWQADVYRDRWYWTDKRVASVQRTLRLAYQPLTRRWRVSVSNDPDAQRGGAGLQYALHQNFDSLAEALAGVSRVSRWRVADTAGLKEGADHRVEFRFRLDLSLLPRPFQIGMGNQPEWMIEAQHRLDVPSRADPDPSPVELPAALGGTVVEHDVER